MLSYFFQADSSDISHIIACSVVFGFWAITRRLIVQNGRKLHGNVLHGLFYQAKKEWSF